VPPAVTLLNYISCGKLWRIFAKLGQFTGFSLYIIYIAGRISEVPMAVDIIFFSLGGPLEGYIGAQTMIFAGSKCYFTGEQEQRSCDGQGGGAEVLRSLEGCLGWAEAGG
jgi:hypothetical protein